MLYPACATGCLRNLCHVFLIDRTDRAVEAEERAGGAGTGMSLLKYQVLTPWMWVTQHTYQSS